MAGLKPILNEFMIVEGVKASLVIGRDGFVIESANASGGVDNDAIAAAISSGIGSSEVIGRELKVGKLDQGMYEYKEGMLIISLLGPDAILAVVADQRCNLGNIRYQVKKRINDLTAAL
ncbi:MAG: roadblock/LC7 domain-containing protein [Deltaproteobacteria bacterium]|nr:roadblock/LC7 domain-containing protein [Deltaproteobacteria bacterium]